MVEGSSSHMFLACFQDDFCAIPFTLRMDIFHDLNLSHMMDIIQKIQSNMKDIHEEKNCDMGISNTFRNVKMNGTTETKYLTTWERDCIDTTPISSNELFGIRKSNDTSIVDVAFECGSTLRYNVRRSTIVSQKEIKCICGVCATQSRASTDSDGVGRRLIPPCIKGSICPGARQDLLRHFHHYCRLYRSLPWVEKQYQ